MSERAAATTRLHGWSRALPITLTAWLLACLLFAAGLGSVEISPAQVILLVVRSKSLDGSAKRGKGWRWPPRSIESG